MKARLEPADCTQLEGHEIKKERAIRFGRKANQLASRLWCCRVENVLEIGGFATQSGSVVNDFAVDFSGSVVDESHGAST